MQIVSVRVNWKIYIIKTSLCSVVITCYVMVIDKQDYIKRITRDLIQKKKTAFCNTAIRFLLKKTARVLKISHLFVGDMQGHNNQIQK
jgi:hypothetical protein